VTGPLWLADALAAVMIVIAAYCSGRLLASPWWRRITEADADGLHVAMGIAMAGMLVPGLSTLTGGAWEAVFGVAAAWFAWQAARAGRGAPARRWRCPHPVPHLIECAAMLYMFMAVPGLRPGAAATAMAGMTGPAGAGSFPVLAIVLALYMAGYVVWTTDRLASLARATSRVPARSLALGHAPILVSSGAPAAALPDDAQNTQGPAGIRHRHPAERPVLAPRLAAGYKIVMGIAMGYMLIMML
jgi:hypothetical protein